jgi:hypothetical protein
LSALRQRLLKASIDDRNIAGMGRTPRHFVFDLERNADRLFGVSKIEALEAVESRSAVLHAQPAQQCGTGSRKIDLGELDEQARIGSTG